MNMLNQIIIEGRISSEVKTKKLPNENSCYRFQIENTRIYKNIQNKTVEKTNHFEIETYGSSWNNFFLNWKVGRGIRIVGRLEEIGLTSDDDKKLSEVFIIVAEHIELKKED